MITTTLAGRELRLNEPRWKAVAAVVPGVALATLHSAILDLPRADIMDALNTDRYRIQWIIGSYLLGAAIGMATTAFWESRIGLRRAYLTALGLFVVTSSLAGTVSEVVWMTPLRLLAGYGMGLVISIGMVLLWREFPDDKELAMAIYGIGLYLAAIFGVSFGGFLTYTFSWRWIFLINLPLGCGIAALGWRLLPPDPPSDAESVTFDLVGFALFAVWVATMNVVLDMGQYWGWLTSPFFVPWFGAFVVFFIGFVAWGALANAPLINLRPFAIRNFGLGLWIKALFATNLYVLLGLLSGYMITLRGYQWWQGGLIILPGFGTMLCTILIGVRWGRNRNRKARMFLGMAGMALLTWYISTNIDLYASKFQLAASLAVWAACAGFVIGPAMLTVFEGLPRTELSRAAGVFNIMRTLPTFAAGSILLILLTRQSDFNFDRLRQNITYNRPLVTETMKRTERHFTERGSPHAVHTKQAYALIGKWVHENARAFAFQVILQYLALITAIGPLLILFVRPPLEAEAPPPGASPPRGGIPSSPPRP